MDEGLFKKYSISIKKNNTIKEDLCNLILEKTGVHLNLTEVSVSKTTVTFHVSSVKKSILTQKKIKEILEEQGYKITG